MQLLTDWQIACQLQTYEALTWLISGLNGRPSADSLAELNASPDGSTLTLHLVYSSPCRNIQMKRLEAYRLALAFPFRRTPLEKEDGHRGKVYRQTGC